MPSALVLTTAGINCDLELAHAFEQAGAPADRVHLNRILDEPEVVDRYDLIGLPGGFSYGDAVAAGRIAAVLMRERIYPALAAAVGRGVPIIAPCNGFQIAAQMGLLPGFAPSPTAPAPTVALARNDGGRFVDRWCAVDVPPDTRCVWTKGLDLGDDAQVLPIAHGEGRFVADPAVLTQLTTSGQVALRYRDGDNPNGSADRIAGICDASGLVLGLMPHPERFTRWTQHPRWTRLDATARNGPTLGLAMFRSAVAWTENRLAAV